VQHFADFRLAALLAALAVAACDTNVEQVTLGVTPASAEATEARSEEPAVPAPIFTSEVDERVRKVLASGAIEKVKKGAGGRSLAFKLTFAGDVEGYFKPEQTFASNWYSELAAYHLDRALGLGRVPPAIGRRIDWELLLARAASDPRLEEVVVRKGTVRGSLVWWVPEELLPVELPPRWEGWLRVDPRLGASPYRNPREYARNLRRAPALFEPPPPAFADRAAELSDLILFDYLIGNLDRWGSGNTNVRVLAGSKQLIYLDNANGFAQRDAPSKLLEARLTTLQRFRASTVEALRALDLKDFERRLDSDPLAPLLSDAQLAEFAERRRRALDHVASMLREHGASALPW
jgi:hypothetical protein